MLSSSKLIASLLRSALFFRQANAGLCKPPPPILRLPRLDYIYWTTSDEMRNSLIEQVLPMHSKDTCSYFKLFEI